MRTKPRPWPLVLAMTLALPCGLAAAQDTPRNTGSRIKEDSPKTGSNIRRDTVWGGALPYDKA